MTQPKSVEGWPSFVDVLAPYVERAEWVPEAVKTDELIRREFDVLVSICSSMSYYYGLLHDVDYPDFWPCYSTSYPIGFNNPDDVYLLTAIVDDATYRISGHRGTVRILELEIGASSWQANGIGGLGPISGQYEPDRDAHIAPDGTFEVVLSPHRPLGYDGDWWELKQGSQFILVRKRSYDWLGEVDARLAIERLDVPAQRPRRAAAEIARRTSAQAQATANWIRFLTDWFSTLEQKGLINRLEAVQTFGASVRGQVYQHGVFDIADDEALILETEVPESCRYWMYHVCDRFMGSIDQIHRQSSLNGFQATIDPDGRFRAVISVLDPGVPNWLDTGGHLYGAISGRWWDTDFVPEPKLRKVKVADLRDHLPHDTPVCTPEQRDVQIRLRRKGAQLRGRW